MHFSIQHNSTLNSNYVSKLHTQWYQTAKKQKNFESACFSQDRKKSLFPRYRRQGGHQISKL